MPQFFPIDPGVNLKCSESDLLNVDWGVNHLSADFALPGAETKALRVRFAGSNIVRLLDEMPLSTENDPALIEGLVPNHFAYRVEGSVFAQTQSEAFKEVFGPVAHYEFITGSGCMDVLSGAEPVFEVVEFDTQ